MTDQGLCFLSVAEAGRLIERRELSPVQLVQAYLERIEAVDRSLNAFVKLLSSQALSSASAAEREISRGRYRGPLHGIPVAVKDIFDVEGIPTTANSHLRRNTVPRFNAASVERLLDSGAILLGKLNTNEFAIGTATDEMLFPPVRNPWNLERTTGGSSTGPAAAVAAGLCGAALGTDSGGSIRGPAALCGIVGLKPTYGRASQHGVVPLARSLDHVGPMTRTVEDAAIVLGVITGYDRNDDTTVRDSVADYRSNMHDGVRGTRIGLVRHFYTADQTCDPEVEAAIDNVAEVLTSLGARIEEVSLSKLQRYHACCMVIILSEAFAYHASDLRERWHEYGSFTRLRLALGGLLSAEDYVQALRIRRELWAEVDHALESVDVLLTAATLSPAPLSSKLTKTDPIDSPVLTSPFNVTGHPAVSVPCGFSKDGLPLGAQLVGRAFDETTVLRVASAYEQATSWHMRHPPL